MLGALRWGAQHWLATGFFVRGIAMTDMAVFRRRARFSWIVSTFCAALVATCVAVWVRKPDTRSASPGTSPRLTTPRDSCRAQRWRLAPPTDLDNVTVWLSHILIRHRDSSSGVALFPKDWLSDDRKSTRSREEAIRLAESLADTLQRAPKTFAENARQFSDDSVTRESGGSLGGMSAAQLSLWPRILDSLAGLAEGQVSNPVETEWGYHVFLRRAPPANTVVSGARIVIGHDDAKWLVYAARRDVPRRSRKAAFALAQKVKERAGTEPEVFNTLVAVHSEHRDAEQGGDIGAWSTREGSMIGREIELLAASQTGEVVGPVDSAVGYEVLLRTPLRPRELFAADTIRLPFVPTLPEDDPESELSVRRHALRLHREVTLDPNRFPEFQAEYCCLKVERWNDGRGPPGLTSVLSGVSIGGITAPTKSEWNYVIARRRDPAALPPIPPPSFVIPTPTKPDLASFFAGASPSEAAALLQEAVDTRSGIEWPYGVLKAHEDYLAALAARRTDSEGFRALQQEARLVLGEDQYETYIGGLETAVGRALMRNGRKECLP